MFIIRLLSNTFVHVPRIGLATERKLWDAGIRDWDDLLDAKTDIPLSAARHEAMCGMIRESKRSLDSGDHRFFKEHLKSCDVWRAFSDFRSDAAYLDIETTGLSENAAVTVVGLFDGVQTQTFIKGQNMDELSDALSRFKLLITFNGSLFDIPMLKRAFPELDFHQLHLDLRFSLKRLGYSGGLKMIEREVGISRSEETQGVDGWEAVRLWYRWARGGDREALDILVKYNIEDIVNLERLAELTYDGLKAKLVPDL